MPRAARILGNDITYHVVANCNAKEFLFKTHSHFEQFLEHMGRCRETCLFELHAYCLLHSHIHLILTTRKDVFLDKIMYEICQRFSFRYNKQNTREGHFWKNRYFSKVIDNDTYGLCCLRYLHRNPIHAGLVEEPSHWPWSCAKHYLMGQPNSLLTPFQPFLGLAGHDATRAKFYQKWVETPLLSDKIERQLMKSKLQVGSWRFKRLLRFKVEPVLQAIRDRM